MDNVKEIEPPRGRVREPRKAKKELLKRLFSFVVSAFLSILGNFHASLSFVPLSLRRFVFALGC